MLKIKKIVHVYTAVSCFFILVPGAVSAASVIADSRHDVSLAGERFRGDKQKLQQFLRQPDMVQTDVDKIDPRLRKLIRQRPDAVKPDRGKGDGSGQVRVVLAITENRDNVLGMLRNKGGKILAVRSNLAAVNLPLNEIEEIVSMSDEIEFARLPFNFSPMGVSSEGVSLTGAEKIHLSGNQGSGVKVAVIDVGFKGLSAAQARGELPYALSVRDYTGNGLQTEYLHGTACAEIVHDMAPKAELHLLKIADEADLYQALDYCITNNIDIISYSLGTFGSGPGNGTGPIDAAFDEARANGILVAASAGNAAEGSHWQGNFYDSDSDDIHEFVPGNEEGYYNAVAAIPYQDDDGNPQTSDLTVIMRWNNWPAATIDYDLYLYDYFTGELAGYSNAVQNGSQPPLEGIVIDLPDHEDYLHYYALLVTKKSGEPAGTEIEISLGGTTQFIPYADFPVIDTPGSSIFEPADAGSVIAVGAVNHADWLTGPQEYFSSLGPTNGWAGVNAYIKPDLSGPDGTFSTVYGNAFHGTSAAAPHVAGAAALILSMSPGLGPDELQAVLESAAVDMGAPGKDNVYGWGRVFIEPVKRGLPWLMLLLNRQ